MVENQPNKNIVGSNVEKPNRRLEYEDHFQYPDAERKKVDFIESTFRDIDLSTMQNKASTKSRDTQ